MKKNQTLWIVKSFFRACWRVVIFYLSAILLARPASPLLLCFCGFKLHTISFIFHQRSFSEKSFSKLYRFCFLLQVSVWNVGDLASRSFWFCLDVNCKTCFLKFLILHFLFVIFFWRREVLGLDWNEASRPLNTRLYAPTFGFWVASTTEEKIDLQNFDHKIS